ncbi:ceramidase domain-containing protein [Hanstruepera marina]|uniref:ceramidase domain-containing protein n=1 Tax=Hanstruepera marina TaxID=2873265 RepID=UPI001CA70531|nr:ceramidase domain-containing protein [Hanstruepera marina]
MVRFKHLYTILTAIGLVLILVFVFNPIQQNQTYHAFCDSNEHFGIPNFWNVITNLPFLIIGCFGLLKNRTIQQNKLQYLTFFVGIVLVSIGSAYYHINPSDKSLVWDRLPMTFVFMALVSIVISDFFNQRTGNMLLIPLLVLGITSILVWNFTGDLRLYAFLQFYPMLAIPIILLCNKSKICINLKYWMLLLFYGVAKGLEYFDCSIYKLSNGVSGHALKHMFSAIGLLVFIMLIRKTYKSKQSLIIKNK